MDPDKNHHLCKIFKLVEKHNLKWACAESCTGGLVASSITSIPGASRSFHGGIVAYANGIKQNILKVPADTLRSQGAVSDAVASAMATGCLDVFHVDAAISTTGIAGPGGATDTKPVGTVWIAAAVLGPQTMPEPRIDTKLLNLSGSRLEIQQQTQEFAFALLYNLLLSQYGDVS